MDQEKSLTVNQGGDLAVFDVSKLEAAYAFSEKLAASTIIPNQLRNKPGDVMVVLQTGIEMGLSPMMALRSVDVIHGTPALKPQTMLALIRSKFPKALVEINDNGTDTASCRMARDKNDLDQAFTSIWTKDRAQTMGLLSKDNWRKQPVTMLRWRSVGEAARMVFPDLLCGLYSSAEVQDFDVYEPDATRDFNLKQSVKDAKTELSEPKDVKSESTQDEIIDAQYKEVGDTTEAISEAKIIGLIENRDYIFPLGEHKGKKLHEVEIMVLREYSKKLEDAALKSSKKMSEAQTALMANLSAYVSKYNSLEKMDELDLDRMAATEQTADELEEPDHIKENPPPPGSQEEMFRDLREGLD